MSLSVRPARRADLEAVFTRSRKIDRLVLTKDATERVNGAASCMAVVCDGLPIALLGCSKPDEQGAAHVWAGFTDTARGHGVQIFKLVRRLLDEVIREFKIERCYTWNHEDALENDRWMRLLGFVRAPEIDATEKNVQLKGYIYGDSVPTRH